MLGLNTENVFDDLNAFTYERVGFANQNSKDYINHARHISYPMNIEVQEMLVTKLSMFSGYCHLFGMGQNLP